MIDRDGYAWQLCDVSTCTVCGTQEATAECVELGQALCPNCFTGLVKPQVVRRAPPNDAAKRAMAAKRTQTAQGRAFQRSLMKP